MTCSLVVRSVLAAAFIAGSSVGRSTSAVIDVGAADVAQHGGVWRLAGRPFSGLLLERDPSGVVRMAVPLVEGLPDGREWRWYDDGSLESVRQYANGHKVGFHRGWWRGGRRQFEADLRDDGFHGRYRAWHAHGRLSDVRTFVEGREDGVQQSWTADGVLFLNYEVRNGRRYGMVNAKPCMPTGKVQS